MTRSNEWTSKAWGTVLKPGAIAAELGNGDPNGRLLGEGSREAQEVAAAAATERRADLAAAEGAELFDRARTVRYVADTGANFCHELKYTQSQQSTSSQARGGCFTVDSVQHDCYCHRRSEPPSLHSNHQCASSLFLGLFMLPGTRLACGCWLARHHPQRQFDLPTATNSAKGCMCRWVPGYLDTWIPWPRTWSGRVPGCWCGRDGKGC